MMRGFFRGWRRKIGVVTLLMTFAVMGAWVRSYSVEDDVWFPSKPATQTEFVSRSGSITCVRFNNVPLDDMKYAHRQWKSKAAIPPIPYDPFDEEDATGTIFRFRWIGFAAGWSDKLGTNEIAFIIPYWLIVLPLALISLWLFHSKPRQSTQTKILNPFRSKELES